MHIKVPCWARAWRAARRRSGWRARACRWSCMSRNPHHFSPAHKSEGFAELICSNSLKAERLDSASGLLKEEMRRMGSQLLNAAEAARVAAGGALAVDRDAFSAEVTRLVEACPNITVHRERGGAHSSESAPILVATGPLTDGALADEHRQA